MTPQKTKAPKKITLYDRLAYAALVFLEKLFGTLPCWLVWKIGALTGQLIMMAAKQRRAIATYNLRLVHPEASGEDIKQYTKDIFRHSFGNLFSSIKTSTIPADQIQDHFETEDFHRLNELSADQGAILLLFHMGNWEMLTKMTALLPEHKALGGMYRPLKNPLIDAHVRNKREADGSLLFSRKRGLIKASQHIRNGGILGILCDQAAGHAGMRMPLFGKETSITPLPAILALKYNCPVFPISLESTTPGKWKMKVHSPLVFPADANKKSATQEIAATMEKLMKAYSKDIFWLHNRWKMKPNDIKGPQGEE
jgi:KDO2-lipid IV(A) lauroyltransferase